jgi:trigger factor
VKSTLEPLEGNKIKLTVEVDEAEFDRDIDQAFRKLAREVRLPGFRPGKAPRRILEARIGLAPAREQALRDAIPQYLFKAVQEHDVDLIAQPDVEITAGQDDGPVAFDATVEVRPQVAVPGYGGLRVELPLLEPTEDEISEVITSEQRKHGSLEAAQRPAAAGDFLTLDISAVRDGEPVPGLNVEDWQYELGQGWVAPTFDEQLKGSSSGDTLEFEAVPNGTEDEATFTVSVKAVQSMVLPELTDEWVADHLGEFETIDEWRANIAERIETVKLNQVRNMLVDRTTAALVELIEDEPPEALVTNELQARVNGFMEDLQRRGISIEQWLSITGQDSSALIENFRAQAHRAVLADLGLRAVADSEALEALDDDIEFEYQRIATQVNEKPATVRKAYEREGAVANLRAQIRKSKALDWLLHHVELVDADGKVLDRDHILGHGPHDHDHDADELVDIDDNDERAGLAANADAGSDVEEA